MSVEDIRETGLAHGAHALAVLASLWEDVQKTRIAAANRASHYPELEPLVEALQKVEAQTGRAIGKQMHRHVMWNWLPSGLRGVHVARMLALIDDPRRFPGQRCEAGHYWPAVRTVGEPCGVETHEGICDSAMLTPRQGTGTRAVWHYFGLHVVDGKLPLRKRGIVADWSPTGRQTVLMPGGIAEQIVRLRIEPYRSIYDETKARLATDRGTVVMRESVERVGSDDGMETVTEAEIDHSVGLRPIAIEKRARIVAAKAFLGDLLAEWKRRVE